MKDILKDFSRRYDVEVDWDSIPDLRFTGTIPNNYSLEKALDLINKTSNSKIILEDKYITLKNINYEIENYLKKISQVRSQHT